MKLNPDVFFIPCDDNYIIYAPLQGAILKVTPSVIEQLQNLHFENNYRIDSEIFNKLVEKEIISTNYLPKRKSYNFEYKPTSVILLPTWNCNLKCKYCYSRGGEDSQNIMDIQVAKSAIDFITINAKRKKLNDYYITYHGGGEPFLEENMPWIKEITSYSREVAKKNKLNVNISAATNGFLSYKTTNWIIKNLDRVNISFDGLEDIQNYQRPTKNGKGSFTSVERTIKLLEENDFPFGIRSTITENNVKRMDEIVQYIHENTSLKRIHLEPLFECGRCNETGIKPPLIEDFINNFIKAKNLAKKYGIKLYNSASELEKIGYKFCGATESNFFVTPDGYVTACLEVSRPNDNMRDIFIIGVFNSEKKIFIFDRNKIRILRKRTVQNIKGCKDCFVKYNCSGDCPAKSYIASGNLFNSSKNPRCEANKAILLNEIKEKLNPIN